MGSGEEVGTFSLGSTRTQPTLQLLHRRGSQENEASIEITVLHLLNTFHLDVQHADALLLGDVLDSLLRCAVEVATELSWRGYLVAVNGFQKPGKT